jgi:hypothetical protein
MSWTTFSSSIGLLDSVLTIVPCLSDEKSFKGLALKSGFTSLRGREKAK